MGKRKYGKDQIMKRLTLDVPEDLHRRLKVLAAKTGKSMLELVLEWVEQQIDRAEKKA
jgi:predicted DNA-binding protein